jgi:hypothetical protein
VLANGGVRVAEMEEVLGRLGFTANALWHIRPWLGPLYAWVAATPSGCYLALPIVVKLILMMIEKEMAKGTAMAPLREVDPQTQVIFRADAMASHTRVGIGGYEEMIGRPAAESPWYAEEILPEDAPWLFEEGRENTFRRIAALEMLATIACVRLFGDHQRHNGKLVKLVGETDNKGNSHVVAKLLSTKFPLCIAVMQLSYDLGSRGADLDLSWIPREDNTLADALSNGVTSAMDPSKRRRFNLRELEPFQAWMTAGKTMYDEAAAAKRAREPNWFGHRAHVQTVRGLEE